jgi:SAM-dependent methyltransferase
MLRRVSDVGSYYDTYWSESGFNPEFALARAVARLLERHTQQGDRCLDVGCGDGRTAGPWLRDRGRDYVGVDVSERAVAAARELGLDARAIDDPAALPFADREFDAALCLEVFEHLFQPQLAAGEILRVLKPGGVLVATVPNFAYWRRRADVLVLGRFHPYGDELSAAEPWRDPHIRFFTRRTLAAMLTSAGFASVRVEGHGGGLVRELPWIGRRIWRGGYSRLYRAAEEVLPNLFALRLNAVAVKGRTAHSSSST